MTDSEEGSTAFSKSLPRACDTCRTRKIRCDKTTPCSNWYESQITHESVLVLIIVVADDLHDMFTWWLFDDVQDFYKMYDEFCHSPSTCPLAISILVYCALCWLLEGNPVMQRAGLNMSEYAAYVPICHRHLATCISSYNLFLEPTDINIAALSSAAAYAIYTADINAAWTLTSTAARLCQSLGYHRLIPDRSGDTKLYEKRAMLFWSVYFIDKSLSLRLGRSSALQDFDISTSAKDIFDIWSNQEPFDYKTAKLAEWLSLSLEMAKIQCFAEPGWLQEYTSFYKESSDVILYSLFTLVYRAMPEVSNAQQLSLQAARSTMQVHYSCSKKAEFMGSEFKLEYMTWSIMLCPFTSFIVLFRNVVTDLNIDDLKLLEDFVASIEWLNDRNQREPLQRFQQLCHAFYNLAKHFVAARLRADHEHRTSSNAGRTLPVNTMQQTTDFDQSLSDVAFPEDFQTWMDTNMDFMNDNWLAFGTL
ncbi:hypothetical protein E4T50_16384 [Aureobasidium sp. EXF-12298]|nr:hypothetical protein E4T50_16384 [Aureobasidium sp. EXF-12298]